MFRFFGHTCFFWIWCQQHFSWDGSNKRFAWNTWNTRQVNRLISNTSWYNRGILKSHKHGWCEVQHIVKHMIDFTTWAEKCFYSLNTASQHFGNRGYKYARWKNGRKCYLLTNLRKRDGCLLFCLWDMKKEKVCLHLPDAAICVWKFSRVQSWVWNMKGELYKTE